MSLICVWLFCYKNCGAVPYRILYLNKTWFLHTATQFSESRKWRWNQTGFIGKRLLIYREKKIVCYFLCLFRSQKVRSIKPFDFLSNLRFIIVVVVHVVLVLFLWLIHSHFQSTGTFNFKRKEKYSFHFIVASTNSLNVCSSPTNHFNRAPIEMWSTSKRNSGLPTLRNLFLYFKYLWEFFRLAARRS